MLLCALQATAEPRGDADLVNERFVTRPGELEDHWKVDCNASMDQALALLRLFPDAAGASASSDDQDPGSAARLASAFNRCAMIYNVPGTAAVDNCPDYHAAARILGAWQASGELSPAHRRELVSVLECPSSP